MTSIQSLFQNLRKLSAASTICLSLAFALSDSAAAQSPQTLGTISDKTLAATLDGCGQALFFAPLSKAEIRSVLALIGWRAMTDADKAWYLDLDSQGNAAWDAYSKGTTDPAKAQKSLQSLRKSASRNFSKIRRSGTVFRGEGDALLHLYADRRECVVYTGGGSAPNRAYNGLPQTVKATLASPLLTARMNREASRSGGLAEANLIDTAAMSRLFGKGFQIKYVFLTSSRP